MKDLWTSLFDSHYDGVNLLVTLLGVAIVYFGGLALIRWDQKHHHSAHVAPVRPPQHFVARDAGEEARWPEKRIQGFPEVPNDDPWVYAALYGLPLMPGRSWYTHTPKVEEDDEIPFWPRTFSIERGKSMHSAVLASIGASLSPGTKFAVTAASEAQAQAVYERALLEIDRPLFGQPGFRIVPRPPYDWQREDSGLA